MINKVLIANRGEIALRIIRTCREMGIKTVAVYSDTDIDSLHVHLADEAVCIGPAPVVHSYLNIPNILSAAMISGADAIHPGYGFLAENQNFVDICDSHKIKFIGPSKESMSLMGDKARAREFMKANAVPVLPGTDAIITPEEARDFINECGFPVLIKAVAGGGGKGMRLVWNKEDFERDFNMAQMEARSSFADERLYIEKYLEKPRHVEIQLICDEYSNVIHLAERDCSVQRRNQKLIEEAPSLVISDMLREKISDAAKKGAKASGYKSLGTIEFLLDVNTEKYYFMEMNTRIQVEHPVTEMVTGIDLVKEQMLIAMGEKISISQDDVKIKGHSIECRINSEDPDKNFAPSCGRINRLVLPGGMGVRVDSHIYQGINVQPFYDSLLGKLIVYADNRQDAINKMSRALDEFIVEGVMTTIPFHSAMMMNEKFRNGNVYTRFVEEEFLKTI